MFSSTKKSVCLSLCAIFIKTSRERPKSAPYPRLKKTITTFLQLETTKALEKSKIEKKNFRFFFRKFFEVSGKSHSAEKCKRGDALGFFEHPFCCKISKIDARNNKKNSEKISLTVPKKEESLIVSKKVDPSALDWLFISC